MSEYISVPLKKGFYSDLVKPILHYIDQVGLYGPSSTYHAQLKEIQKLRSDCIEKCDEANQKTLSLYQRYADEIISLDLKLPLTENQIRIKFKWQDAFSSSKVRKNTTLVLASGSYEKACVLFNLAALSVAVAQQQNVDQDDGLKTSAKLFQQASGIYTYLVATSRLTFGETECTNDLQSESLGALASLMLARAQDIFVKKAIQDSMKASLLAKLCQQCSVLYEETAQQLKGELQKIIFNKEWVVVCSVKKSGFQAMAYYYEGKSCYVKKEFAEGLARFRQAKDAMSKCQSSCSIKPFPFGQEQKLLDSDLAKSEKENTFIFHTGVPDFKKLPLIEKAVLAKPTPVESIKFSPDSKDLLDRLLPWSVQQAALKCEEKGMDTIQKEIGKLNDASRNLNAVLVTLNLPAALEDMVGNQLPKSISEKSAKIKTLGGSQHLERLVADLPAMVQKCKGILDNCEKALNEEVMEDRKLRMMAGNMSQRTASEILNNPFKEEMRRHRMVVNEARQADAMVRQKYAAHKNNISLLSETDSDIERSLPENKSTGKPDLKGKRFVGDLLALLRQTEEIKVERKSLEEKFKNTKIDAAPKFMVSFKKNGALYEETATREELDRAFSGVREASAKNVSSQERMVKQIQISTKELNQFKTENGISSPVRDSRIKELASSFDNYMELHATVNEGNKFYMDFTLLLEKFQVKVKEFCVERGDEKADLMRTLSSMPEQQTHFMTFSPSPQQHFSTQTLYSALPSSTVMVGNRPTSASYFSPGAVSFNPYSAYARR